MKRLVSLTFLCDSTGRKKWAAPRLSPAPTSRWRSLFLGSGILFAWASPGRWSLRTEVSGNVKPWCTTINSSIHHLTPQYTIPQQAVIHSERAMPKHSNTFAYRVRAARRAAGAGQLRQLSSSWSLRSQAVGWGNKHTELSPVCARLCHAPSRNKRKVRDEIYSSSHSPCLRLKSINLMPLTTMSSTGEQNSKRTRMKHSINYCRGRAWPRLKISSF